MKNLGLFMLLALAGLTASAASNPQMRACRVVNGQFFVIDTGLDQLGLCRIGYSVIGAIDLLNKDASIEDMPFSVYEYSRGTTTCEADHIATFPSPGGSALKVCYYDDGSLIDLQTLNRGKSHPHNWYLNKALGLTQ
jgi:hypothetical protein